MQLPHVERSVVTENLEEEGARGELVRAVCADDESRRRIGGNEELEEQVSAVEIAPLEVVDRDDDAISLGEPTEQRAKRAKRAVAGFVDIARLAHPGLGFS